MQNLNTPESIKKALPPKFQNVIEIGEGGENRVYKVFDTDLGFDVALKILKSDLGISLEIAKHEFRLLSQLSHEHIVRVYDFGFLNTGAVYFTQEFLQGISITEFFHHSFDDKVFLDAMIQILYGLSYLKKREIIHGDLKPENIFVLTNQERIGVKLIDFGMSRLRSDRTQLSGTIEYISPEQIRGEQASAKSDLYSLGIILFEIIYGVVPFRGNSISEILRKHLLDPFPILPAVHHVSDKIHTLVKNLLIKDPAVRPGSADEIIKSLLTDSVIDMKPPQPELIRLPPAFSGRAAELKQFDESISEKREGVVCIISGEDGLGKTRFMQECKVRVQLQGFDTMFVAVASLQPKNIFGFIRSIISQSESLGRINQNESDTLRNQITNFENDSVQSGEQNTIMLQRIMDHAIDVITTESKSNRCMVFVDDMHELDEHSIGFIESLVRISALRSSETFNFVFSTIDSGSGTNIGNAVMNIVLQPFQDDEMRSLVQSIFRAPVCSEVVDRLVTVASGKPFDLIEHASYLYENNFLELRNSEWCIKSGVKYETALPKSLQQIARIGIHKLSKDEREILNVLSLSNIPLTCDHLRACIKNLSEQIIVGHLSSLMASGTLIFTGNGYSFRNYSFKEALREAIDAASRTTYHLLLADTLSLSDDATHLDESGSQYEQISEWEKSSDAYITSGEKYLFYLQLKKSEQVLKNVLSSERHKLGREQLCRANSLLGRVYQLGGKYALYGEVAEELHHLLREKDDEIGLTDIFIREAEIYSTLGNPDRAIRTARKALELAMKHHQYLKIASSHVQLGIAGYHQGKYRDAIQEYEQGIELFIQHDAQRDAASTLLNAGFAATFSLSPHEGIKYFERAESIYTKLDDEYGRARSLGNLGVAYYLLGQYQKSLDTRLEANQIFTSLYDKRGQANAESGIGKVLETMGIFGDCETHLHNALLLMREIGDQLGEARCHETLGLLALDTGRYEMALSSYRKAQDIARHLDNTDMLVQSYQNYALTYFYQSDLDSCERELSRASQLRNEVHDQEVLLNLDIARMMFLARRNKGDDPDAAKKLAEELLQKIKKESYDSYKRWLLIKKSEILLMLDDPYAAYSSSSAAVEDLIESKYDEWPEQEIFSIHSQVCRAVGKLGESHAYLRRAYDEIQRKAETCHDQDIRKSFLEHVPVNSTIVSEYLKVLEQPKRATDQLIMNDRSLNALYKVSATINSILELELLLPRILDLAIETMQGERGMIFLIEDEKLELHVARNVDRDTIADAAEISESVIHDVVQYGKPLIVDDAQQNNSFRSRQSVRNFQITSIVCVPLRLKDKIIGTVYIDRRASFQPHLTDIHLDLQFLEAFANLAAIAIENARLHKNLQEENKYLKQQVSEQFGFGNIIGNSLPMQAMYRLMKGAMQADSPVFIYGESGTGKELVARAIHFHGLRRDRKFIAIDCGALPETLLESELFGHTKGAFTGALSDKKGLFEEADGGTVFLDEITNTTASFQSRLLRVLQEGEIRRIGENEVRHIDIRVIAATNLEIENEVTQGRFRQDLFYRLNVIPITVPSLKERREDIPILVRHFISKYSSAAGKKVMDVSQDLIEELSSAEWKGNVRELENIIHRLIIFTDGEILTKKTLKNNTNLIKPDSEFHKSNKLPLDRKNPESTNKSLNEVERIHILGVLGEARGNKTEAARILNMKRTTLLKRMKKLGIYI